MTHKVIIQFNSFETRDRWFNEMQDRISRVYKRNPWLAAEVSDDELQQLEQRADVEIFPDTQMRPFAAPKR